MFDGLVIVSILLFRTKTIEETVGLVDGMLDKEGLLDGSFDGLSDGLRLFHGLPVVTGVNFKSRIIPFAAEANLSLA